MKKVISILGPTNTGKTNLAVALSQEIDCKLISVDSVQAYKFADIGSNKPKPEVLKKNKHYLIDILEPNKNFSVNSFLGRVEKELKVNKDSIRIPLFVGGSMMYFYSLLNGISKLPSKDNQLRKKIEVEAEQIGWNKMHEKLLKLDPEIGKKINSNDSQRIQRALEVNLSSGKSMSDLQKESKLKPLEDYKKFTFAIVPRDKKKFKNELKQRFLKMIQEGLIDEVSSIQSMYEGQDIPVLKSIGYKQVCQYLAGELTKDGLIERATNATYQYSKRQITWLNKIKVDCRFYSDEDDKVMKILSKLKN